MTGVTVRLDCLDRGDDLFYRLNWLGKVRRRQRFEIFGRFVSESVPGGRPRQFDCWLRLTDFPFLIIGSRWFRGSMVGKPSAMREIRLASSNIIAVHAPTRTPQVSGLWLGTNYPLAFDQPASPLVELESADGTRLFVCIAEIYRAHYFSIPRALPGVMQGLHRSAIDNPTFMAWEPALTRWVDEESRIAQIAPGKFIRTREALYLARLLFSKGGQATLDRLQDWTSLHFMRTDGSTAERAGALLPTPVLPYEKATWVASTVPMAPTADGRRRLLITHIDSFDAPEPYSELLCVDAHAPRTEEKDDTGEGGGPSGGEVLEPVPPDPVNNRDEGWDPQLEPVVVRDVITKDRAAQRRDPERVKREPESLGPGGRTPVEKPIVTDAASTEPHGRHGSGIAPIVFSDDPAWPIRDEGLDWSFDAIRRAMERAVAAHRQCGISADYEFIPDASHALQFQIRRSETSRGDPTVRQFVVAEVRLGRKYAVVIEPQRRCEDESLPLGIVWRLGAHLFGPVTLDGVREIVRHLESAAFQGHSWIPLEGLAGLYRALAVRHPPAKLDSARKVSTFGDRILDRLMASVGDARAAALLAAAASAKVSADGLPA